MAAEKIKTFNNIIESFLNQTSPLIGPSYHKNFKRIIKVNSTMAIENSIKFMLPHKERIFNMDESYFSEEKNLINNFISDRILLEIHRLKEIYYKLDKESKKNVWNTLQALVQITIEYCDIKGIKY
jgi:predicted nucleic-acid-binding protein